MGVSAARGWLAADGEGPDRALGHVHVLLVLPAAGVEPWPAVTSRSAGLPPAWETNPRCRSASSIGPGGEGPSGGQRRRLRVAQAYLRHPGRLLLDEPTEGLYHRAARALLENLRSALA